MSKSHFYVGNTPYPGGEAVQVSPGTYTYIHQEVKKDDEDDFKIARLPDGNEVYIIAHAVIRATARRHLQADGCACMCVSDSFGWDKTSKDEDEEPVEKPKENTRTIKRTREKVVPGKRDLEEEDSEAEFLEELPIETEEKEGSSPV